MNKSGYVFHFLAFVFCRGKYAISIRHRNIFLPRGGEKRSDWEMFVVTFLFPWLFSTKAIPGSTAKEWECISNPALWALSSSPFFPSTRQDKGWIFLLIFLGWINTWDMQKSTDLLFIAVHYLFSAFFLLQVEAWGAQSWSWFKAAAYAQDHKYLSGEQAQCPVDASCCPNPSINKMKLKCPMTFPNGKSPAHTAS